MIITEENKFEMFKKTVRNAPTVDAADSAIEKLFGITDLGKKIDLLRDEFGIRIGRSHSKKGEPAKDTGESAYYAALDTLIYF